MKLYTLATLMVPFLMASTAMANKDDVDLDNDGLIEINSIHELDRMRYNPEGTHYNESNAGCPSTGCFGFELTQDLDFDSDGDGDLSDEDFWNGGLGWEPIQNFYGRFQGNGHEIRNLMIDRPTEDGTGLFRNLQGRVNNLRLTGDLMSIRGGGAVGALAGYTTSVTVSDVASTGGVIGGRNSLGGLIGSAHETSIYNSSATGNVVVDNDIPAVLQTPSATHVGGLVGLFLENGRIEQSFATGNVAGGEFAGGLVGYGEGVQIFRSFATGAVEGSHEVGGLVGKLISYPRSSSRTVKEGLIHDSYASGNVVSAGRGGALVGSMETAMVPEWLLHPIDGEMLTPKVWFSYATGTVVINGVQTAALVGGFDRQPWTSNDVIYDSYWAIRPVDVLPEPLQGLTGGGATLAQLRCPTGPGNTSCADVPLYRGWNLQSVGEIPWHFGTSSDLPYLLTPSNAPWMNTDGPSGEGDNETIDRIQSRDSDYPCLGNPEAVLEAKLVKGNIVYRNDYPATLEFFNIHEGLGCRDTQQPNGAGCPDFEVGYLCSGEWTAYHDRDNPSGEGDYEHASKSPVRCSNPTEIRARVKGQTQVYYGTPDKLALFSAAEGLQCLKSDQQALGSSGCQNYSVRLSCPQRSFH